jgi:hypothetical protein
MDVYHHSRQVQPHFCSPPIISSFCSLCKVAAQELLEPGTFSGKPKKLDLKRGYVAVSESEVQ